MAAEGAAGPWPALLVLALHAGLAALVWRPVPTPPAAASAVLQVRLVGAGPVAAPAPAPRRSTVRPAAPAVRTAVAVAMAAPAAWPGAATPDEPVLASVAPAAPPPAVADEPAAAPPATEELQLLCPQRPPPSYPPAARRAGAEGTVQLSVELSAQGEIAAVVLLVSSGHRALDEAAAAAVRRWRCHPPRAGGQALAAQARQTVRFVLPP
ncbi:MAG: energy transducer TonB [Rubrivivax sp.]